MSHNTNLRVSRAISMSLGCMALGNSSRLWEWQGGFHFSSELSGKEARAKNSHMFTFLSGMLARLYGELKQAHSIQLDMRFKRPSC